MKTHVLAFLLIVSICDCAYSQHCDASLWQHVYNPDRFTVWKRCTSVTGTIMAMKKEADGDYHIQMQIDPGQRGFINQRNIDAQKGCLVLEIICYNKVTQADAKDPCKDCPENVQVPKVGDHVKVTGSFVKDLEGNHGWNEIHPVSSIETL